MTMLQKKEEMDAVKAAEETVAKITALENRIKAPSIWGRHICGLRFEDLQEKRYEECIRFLKKHYIKEELTWASVKLGEDKEATDEFIHNARIWLKDKMSIAVLKEGTDKLGSVFVDSTEPFVRESDSHLAGFICIHNARIWLKDKMSIAVLEEGTAKLVECLIMRIQHQGSVFVDSTEPFVCESDSHLAGFKRIYNGRIWLEDKMSIAVLMEGTYKLVKCLIIRIPTG